MPSRSNNKNARGGSHNNNNRNRGGLRFNHRVNNGRIHRQNQHNYNLIGINTGSANLCGPSANNQPLQRTIFNSAGSSHGPNIPVFSGFQGVMAGSRQLGSHCTSSVGGRGGRPHDLFSSNIITGNRQYERRSDSELISTHTSSSNSSSRGNSRARDCQQSSGVLGRMEPDGTFVPINPLELFGTLKKESAGHQLLNTNNVLGSASSSRPSLLGAYPQKQEGESFLPGINSAPKKLLCKHYSSARGCLNRSRCNYMHEEFPCKLYHILGECTEGSECKYSHEKMNTMKKNFLATHMEKGVQGFPKMTRTEVFAHISRVEKQRAASSIEKCTELVAESPSTSALSEELVEHENAADTSSSSGSSKAGLETVDEMLSALPGNPFRDEQASIAKSPSSPGSPLQPTIHQIIQIMRKNIQQSSSQKSHVLNNKSEKRGEDRTPVVIARTTFASIQKAERSLGFVQGEKSNLQVSIAVNGGNNSSPGPLDLPSFRSVAQAPSSSFSKRPCGRQARVMPSLASIISTCIGHGPPFTSWQMCQIYNSCAEQGSSVSLSDLMGFSR